MECVHWSKGPLHVGWVKLEDQEPFENLTEASSTGELGAILAGDPPQ